MKLNKELERYQPQLIELAENVLDYSLLEIGEDNIEQFINRLTQEYSNTEIIKILSAYYQSITVACLLCKALAEMYC